MENKDTKVEKIILTSVTTAEHFVVDSCYECNEKFQEGDEIYTAHRDECDVEYAHKECQEFTKVSLMPCYVDPSPHASKQIVRNCQKCQTLFSIGQTVNKLFWNGHSYYFYCDNCTKEVLLSIEKQEEKRKKESELEIKMNKYKKDTGLPLEMSKDELLEYLMKKEGK